MSNKNNYIRFGPHEIHRKYGTEHFQVVGTTGSGKTVIAKELMASVLDAPSPVRMCLYDPKTEFLPVLYKLLGDDSRAVQAGRSRVKVLNPLDERAYAWDIAKDIKSPVAARQVATNLFPSESPSTPDNTFFMNAAIDVLTTVILIFVNCMPNLASWTLRDVFLAAMNETYLRFLFDYADKSGKFEFPTLSRVKKSYIDTDPRTAANIASTICTNLAVFEPIAACWDAARKAGRTISLAEWVMDESHDILVLGNDETARASIDAVNRTLFKRISELVVGKRESTFDERESGANQTWIVLDEAREAGPLDGLRSLLNKGRSRSACVALFYQDIQGLIDVYGESVADEITGQSNNAAFLRIVSPATAKRAVESFGTSLGTGRGNGISFGDTPNFSHNTNEEERPLLYSSDFMYLPPAGVDNGISGYYRLAGYHPKNRRDAFAMFMPEDFKKAKRRSDEPERDPVWLSSFMPRPVADQYLQPWNTDDWDRLGLPGEPPSWRTAEASPGPSVSELMQAYIDGQSRNR